MGALGFFGLLFLGFGPLVVVFLACIARKSFLVLLGLARCGGAAGEHGGIAGGPSVWPAKHCN